MEGATLLNLAQKLQDAKQGRAPAIEQWIATLDEADRDALLAAAGDDDIATNALYRILHDAGLKIGKDRLAEWRRSHGLTR